MPSLPLELREKLWNSGFAGIESALRYAHIELALSEMSTAADFTSGGDDVGRHLANFLAWSDSVLVGIDKAVRSTGDQRLIERWRQLQTFPLRQLMRKCRNDALKGREVIVGIRKVLDLGPEGALLHQRFARPEYGTWDEGLVGGTAHDYLSWVGQAALPLLFEATSAGAKRQDPRSAAEMPHREIDPWTADAAFDVFAIGEMD